MGYHRIKSFHPSAFKKGGMIITRKGIHYLNDDKRKRSESPKKEIEMKMKNLEIVDGRGFKPIKPLKFNR
jgi:hypothetical protein